MKHSFAYRFFILAFLLVFSFFHVGYAAIEYICSMGMEMESPVCTSCHTHDNKYSGRVTIGSNSSMTCCTVKVTQTETTDTYVINQLKVLTDLERSGTSVTVLPIIEDEKPAVQSLVITPPVISAFNSHGISTSIQYTSFLR